jgi:repressor LexA
VSRWTLAASDSRQLGTRSRYPRHGQVVAALVDGERTLKTYVVKNGKPYLKAENPKYPDLIPAQELVIQGVFKALIRKAD